VQPGSERICPVCDTGMSTLNIGHGNTFLIERCETCLGIFFDPGEVRGILDRLVGNVYEVDRDRIEQLINEQFEWKPQGPYVKCPICRALMSRKIYGVKSGVVVDMCRSHGSWIDGGELGQLLRWAKAGGQIVDEQHRANDARKAKIDARAWGESAGAGEGLSMSGDSDLLSTVLWSIMRMF
jgi:Zn-finger nucleic acid-binding protein